MYLDNDPIRVSSGVFKPFLFGFRLLALSIFLLISVNAAARTPVSMNVAAIAAALNEGSTGNGDAAVRPRHVDSDLDSAVVVLPPPPPDNGSTGDDVLLRVER